MALKNTNTGENTGEVLVAWQTYLASGPDELSLEEGDVVQLIDTEDPTKSPFKRLKLDPELENLESPTALLDNTAAKHKLAVKPPRKHASSRYSPTRNVLNSRWLVRQTKGDKKEGWVPCRVLQSVDEPIPGSGLPGDAAFRRQAVVKELVETEQEFVKDLDYVVQQYLIRTENTKVPKVIKDNLELVFGGLVEIADFHRTVLMEGVKYYANEPNLLGKAFLRLERDFDKHVHYCSDEPLAQAFLEGCDIAREYYDEISQRLSDDKTLSEHLKLPIQRINDYQLLLRELIRYSECLQEDSTNLQKALELMLSVPHRAQDDKFLNSIEGYRGSIYKLGRLLSHDWFSVTFGTTSKERYLFLFKARILVTKVRRISDDRSIFQLKDIIRLPQVEIKDYPDPKNFELVDKVGGQSILLTAHRENVKKVWVKEIREFSSDVEENIVEDFQIVSEISATSDSQQTKAFITQTEKSPEPKGKQADRKREVEEEAKPAKVPKLSQPKPEELVSKDVASSKEAVKLEVSEAKKATVEKIDSGSKPTESVTDTSEMSRKYTSLSSGKGGEEYESSFSRRSIKSSYSTGDGHSSSRFESLSGKYGAGAESSLSSKYVPTSLSNKYGAESSLSSKYDTDSISNKYSSEKLLSGRHETDSSLSNKYESVSSRYGESGTRSSSSRSATILSEPDGSRYGGESTLTSSYLSRRTIAESGVADNGDTSTYLKKYKASSTDVDDGLTSTYSRKYSTDTGDGDSYSYNKRTITSIEGDGGGMTRYSKKTTITSESGDLQEPKYSRKSYTTVAEDDSLSREALLDKYSTKGDLHESIKRSVSTPETDADDTKSKYSKYERRISETHRKVTVDDDDEEEARIEAEMRKKYAPDAASSHEHATSDARHLKSQISREKQGSYEKESHAEADSAHSFKKETFVKESYTGRSESDFIGEDLSQRNVKYHAHESDLTTIPKKKADEIDTNDSIATTFKIKRDSSSASVPADGKPVFIRNLSGINVEPGEPAAFEVELASYVDSVTWLKDNKPVKECVDVKAKKVEEHIYQLEINKTQTNDAGLYSAVATNSFGKSTCSAQLIVHELTDAERAVRLENDKPVFLIKLKDTELLEDTYLRFMVKVRGDPSPKVAFYKDDIKIRDSDKRCHVNKEAAEKGFYELIIPDVKPEDAGTYKCIASNKFGEVFSEATVTVTESKKLFEGLPEEPLLDPSEKPVFTWKKDGINFEPEERFKVLLGDDEDSLALVFQHVRPEDAGLYTCVAQTSSGHISCSAELTVHGVLNQLPKEPVKPTLVVEKREAVAQVGTSAMLELQVKGYPKPQVKWTHEGKPIEPSGKYKFLYEDEESISLVIKDVQAEDSGTYVATAQNELGGDTAEVTLNVKAPPKIKSKLENITAEAELTIKVPVEVEGIPKPTVQFFKDGQEIKKDERIKIVEDGVKHTLIIEESHIKDSGSYSVVASNEISQVSKFFEMDVYSKPKVIKKMGKEKTVTHSEDIKLIAHIESRPEADVKWFKNEEEITSGGKYLIKKDGDLYVLKITGSVSTDAASYKVRAKNIHGTVDDDCVVYVKRPPTITKGLEDMTVTEYDNNVTLDVKHDAYPKPTVKWYLDETEISEFRKEFTRFESDDGTKLIIKEVNSDLSGRYKCKLINELGETETSAKLTVNCKPRFIRQLHDVTVDEGATLHLEVEVDAYPQPTVKWLRNGREVSADARIKITRDSHRYETFHLAVDLIKYEEQGEYEVVVTNTLGTVSSKSIVTVQIPPRLIDSNIKDKTQYESLELFYEIQAEASPTPTPIWTLNGKPLTADSHYNIHDDGKKFQLEIKKLALKDAGTLECKLVNLLGEIKQKAVLNIIPEVELRKPKIIKGLEDQTVVKGTPVKLVAVMTADPLPEISWCINGKEITPEQYENSGIILDAEDHDIEDGLKECTVSLSIPRSDQVNTGKYTIKAKNKWSEAESSAQLTIILRPEIDGPEDLSIVPGNEAEFNVVIRANPEPVVTWYKDGSVLSNSSSVAIVSDVPNEKYKLVIKKVQLEDDGKYKVTAKNELGETCAEARLRAVTEKPHFVTGLVDAEVEENGEIVLKVRADGLPTPEIRWFFNGKPLQENDNHKIDHKADTHRAQSTLAITRYSLGDIGQYKAMAVNLVGEAETTATVGLQQVAPSFGKHFERSEELNEGEPLELKAKIAGSPIPTPIWCKDGEPIQLDDGHIKTTLLPDGTVKMNIEKVTPADSGAYKLVIKNPKGETSALCAVAVNPKPQRPKFTKCFKDAKVTDGDTLRLEAVVGAHPPPEIKWLKDGALVRPSSNVHLEHHPDGKVALVVDCAKPENAGTYHLTATNKLGEAENDAKVKVEKKPAIPEFVSELQQLNVVEGFPAIFEIKTKGFPPPKITWTRNGVEIVPDSKHITINELPDGTNTLVIDACDVLRDPMLYKAVATNEAGKAESAARLTVTPATKENEPEEAPVLLHSLRDMTADEEQPLVIELPFTANPMPHVQWFKDGIPLPSSSRVLQTCDGKKVGLRISETTPSDSGTYGVVLTNPLGSDGSEGIVSIHKIFSPPRFTQRFGDLQQVIGRDAKFAGKVSGIPMPLVTWYKDGVQLENSEKYQIKKEGDACTLIVKDCDSFDNGLYRAFAVNKEGSDTCEADFVVVDKIDVTPRAEPPAFLKKIGDLELYPGMSAKFTACAGGFPEPQVEWFKDNQKLHPSNRIKMEVDRAGLLRLTVMGIQEEDLGKYSCKIFNDHGSDICHADLRFDDLDTQSKRPLADEYIDYDKHQKSGVPVPLADAPIISRMTDRHCTLSWKPSIVSYPRTPVTYQLEMCEMPHGDWFVARSGIRSCVCGVANLEPFRDYRFRVRVENKYGISDPSPYATTYREKLEPPIAKPRTYLPPGSDFHPDNSCYFPKDFDIERPPHDHMAQPPQFLRQEHPTQYGIKDQNTNLFWYVYGYPKPKMQYYFNDEPIECGGRFDTSYTRNGQATLFINKMLARDVGWYDAVATNEHGQARQRVRLEIAEPPEFITRPDIQYAMLRGKVRFEAHIIGKPYPEIKWYKDWKPLAESTRIKIRFLEPDHAILSIDDVMAADGGLYSVSARNVAGTASSSAMLYIDENTFDYKLHTFEPISQIKTKRKLFDDFYDLGDELGRGTQGITYHAVERKTGSNYAAKIMHGRGDVRHFMYNELDMYNHLRHRRLISLYDAYETSDGLTLVLELGAGGELFKDYLMKRDYYSEYEIAGFIKQLLEGVQYMHERGYAHMGLNLGDLLLSHSGGTDLKITDLGLTRRITPGSLYPLLYGVPEYVSPEAAKGEATGFAHDMWSIGIITYILLSGRSPFLGKDDRETLTKIKYGSWTFSESCWNRISVEARDFITKLLVYQPESRMDIHSAVRHPWLERIERTVTDEYRISSSSLTDYFTRFREWYDNASCRRWFRRRPLEGAFTHPSRMVYPPGEVYTPPSSPPPARRILPPPTKTWEDQLPSRSPLNYEIGLIKSESHYQNGPDTYLLQLRDVGFPVRIREYMKIAATRGPGRSRIISDDNGFDWEAPSVRERRRFMDVMDEEIDDERKARINRYGVDTASLQTLRRLRHELGTRLDTYAEAEAFIEARQEGRLPFFREKPQITALVEGKDLDISCYAVGDPKPTVLWFKNEAIIAESARIKIMTDADGRSHLKFRPALGFDLGMYKIVARNKVGQAVARTRIVYGTIPDAPDSPEASQISDTEILLTWKPPKSDGNSQVLCYSLQYKLANEAEWKKKAENIDHEFYLMSGLVPNTNYMFRLAAYNVVGWSEQGVSTGAVCTAAEGASKITISMAMKHLQQITDRGDELLQEPPERPDYNLENKPVEWTEGDAQDQYEFLSEISRGKFSAVLKAIDRKTNRIVVVKVVDLNAETTDSVDGEFAALRSLRHERIAGLLAAYRRTDIAAFVLEKLQGADILTYLASKHEYSEQAVATIITQILDGLQYLHWRNLCHLDLQPDNVVMCDLRSVQIKLVDFGAAHRVTKLGTKVPIVGHPDYISPEVLNEEPAFPQSDIWSVGVLAYLMLSGRVPFQADDENEARQNITFVRYRFEYLYQELSQEGNRFIMNIFKRHPNKRPTAEECHENRWLLPTDSMIKKKERAIFLGSRLKEYSDKYHNQKDHSAKLSKVKSLVKSHSIQDELLIAP